MLFRKQSGANYIATNLATIVGIVLIWRGIWIVMDAIDYVLFGGSHAVSGILSAAIGLFILYLPNKNLEALERL